MARFSNGWVKIHRAMINGDNYDSEEILLLVWLICNANYIDGKNKIKGKYGRLVLKRGELCLSINELINKFKMTSSVINTRLNRFQDEQIIEKRTSNFGTIVTILNYDKFQSNEDEEYETKSETNDKRIENESQTDHKRIANGSEHIKELKNLKNEKKVRKIRKKELNTSTELSSVPSNELIAFYCEKYKQRFKINPVITGKEAGAAKNIAKTLSVEKVKELIDGYFSLSDSWIVQKMYPLDMLQNASLINRIMAKKEGIDVSANKAKEFEKQTEAQNIINRMFGNDK